MTGRSEARRSANRLVRSAFTLMEMLVVVAIIVALAGMGGYYYFAQLDKANESKAKVQVKTTLKQACDTYRLNNGHYPESLEILLHPDQANAGKPYLENREAITDPWGQPYGYDANGQHNGGDRPDIWANSPRGQIGNWPGSL
jgi:general secretion pathway protein G